MIAATRIRQNVGCFKHRQRVLLRNGAGAAVRISDSDSEGTLSEPRPHQDRLAVPFFFLTNSRHVPSDWHSGCALETRAPNAGTLSNA